MGADTVRTGKLFAGSFCLLALVLLAPLAANAQVTVFHVRVTVANNQTATYCDVGLACGPTALSPWNIPALGIALAPGQTLVLTQTGSIPVGGSIGSNFDTSERIRPAGVGIDQVQDCFAATGNGCTTNIWIDTGGGLQLVYSNASGNELTAFNLDSGASTFQEARPWSAIPVFSSPNYTLSLGYADNVHGPPGCLVNCTPTPFSNATVFLGAGLPPVGQCTTAPCWDAGALLITGVAHQLITVTQGGWGSPPHGNNPGALLADNFSSVFPTGITLGCPAGPNKLVFTTAAQIEAFLPSGGKPGPLPDTNVLTGQLLAAMLNVAFSNAGVLPTGLGGLHIASGPFAGKTVNQVIAMANRVIGGCPIQGDIVDFSALNDVLTGINEAFDDGSNTGFVIP
jgi:hypothetical protein